MEQGQQDARQLGIAVAQFAPGDDTAANLRAIRELALSARDAGAGLLLAPEYASRFRQPFDEQLAGQAEPLDGAFTDALKAIAAETGLHLVSGLLERRDVADGRFSNTVVAVSPAGETLAVYRKQHLYDAFGNRESRWVAPGALEEPQLFEAGGLSIGLQTCYDLRFPEITRRIVDAGAEVVLVPAQWVPGPRKEQHWRTLATARAIENTIYLAAADQAAPAGIGVSLVIDPRGDLLAELGAEPGLAVGVARGELLDEVRRINPALALRRYAVVPRD